VDTADLARDPDVGNAEARGEPPRHFVIDDSAALTEGGWTAKLEDNLGAIRLLKAIEREGRAASINATSRARVRFIVPDGRLQGRAGDAHEVRVPSSGV
jgi:hypothetical protein